MKLADAERIILLSAKLKQFDEQLKILTAQDDTQRVLLCVGDTHFEFDQGVSDEFAKTCRTFIDAERARLVAALRGLEVDLKVGGDGMERVAE